jgi:hypothetical protein
VTGRTRVEIAIAGAIAVLFGPPVVMFWLTTHPYGGSGPCSLERLVDIDAGGTRLLYTAISTFPVNLHEVVVPSIEAATLRSHFVAPSWIRVCETGQANRLRIENLRDPVTVIGVHAGVHEAPYAFPKRRAR